MNTRKRFKFLATGFTALLAIRLAQAALWVPTDFADWPSTPDWVQHTNTIQQLYNAYNERHIALDYTPSSIPLKISPTFIYPYQDYITLVSAIDNLVSGTSGYLNSTNADANGSFLAYMNAHPTNNLHFTPATLHAAAGFQDWATNQPVHLWMAMEHSVQTQVWAALNQLKYTFAGTAGSQWTSYGVTNYYAATTTGTTRAQAATNLANMWMTVPTNTAVSHWALTSTPDAKAALTITGFSGYWQITGWRIWGYFQSGLIWTGAQHTADFYFKPDNASSPNFDPEGTSLTTNMNMVPGPVSYSYTNMITATVAPGMDVFSIAPTNFGTANGTYGYEVSYAQPYVIARWQFTEYPCPTVEPTTEDLPDSDRDDIVDPGVDVASFGPDSGAISFLAGQDLPYVTIPLASTPSWYGGPAVHAYLSQGAVTNLPYQYLVYGTSDYGKGSVIAASYGPYQAFSLNSRLLDSGSVTNGGQHIKRAAVLRPRGNVVILDFPWDTSASKYSTVGYPVGINSNRTYVLRDLTPSNDTDLQYELVFASGITHRFNGTTDISGLPDGTLSDILSVSGTNVTISVPSYGGSNTYGLPGATLNASDFVLYAASDAKYNVGMSWSAGMINQVTYASKDGSQTITATIASDAATRKITGISKAGITGIDQSDSSVSGDTITYNWGTLTRSQDAPAGQARTVTLTAAPTGSAQITRQVTFNSRDLPTSLQTSVSGQNTTTSIQYNDSASGRYDNGFPKQAKTSSITYPDLSTEQLSYDANTGWLTQKDSPVSSTLTRSVVYGYSASSGDGANVSNLVERPRSVTVKLNDTAVAATLYAYSGASQVVAQQCVTPGAGWNATGNLVTTNTYAVGGLTNGLPLSSLGPVVSSTWQYGIGGLSGGTFVSNGMLSAVAARNTGVTVSNAVNAFGYPVSGSVGKSSSGTSSVFVASSFATSSADGFGRPLATSYSDGTTNTFGNYCLWGPQTFTRRDNTTVNITQYDTFGRAVNFNEPDFGRSTVVTVDPLGLQQTIVVTQTQSGKTRTYSSTVDLLGRPVSLQDPVSSVDWNNYTQTADGWKVTIQPSGLGAITQETFKDGSLSKVYGAGAKQSIGFTLAVSGGQATVTATALDPSTGNPKSETYAVACNAFGQPVSGQQAGVVQQATFEYAANGLPFRATDESGCRTLADWDNYIGLEKFGVKADGSGNPLNPGGTDRMFRFGYGVDGSGETRTANAYLVNNSSAETPYLSCFRSHDGLQMALTVAGQTNSVAMSQYTAPATFTADATLADGTTAHESYAPIGTVLTTQTKDKSGTLQDQTTVTVDDNLLGIHVTSTALGNRDITLNDVGCVTKDDATLGGGECKIMGYLSGTTLPNLYSGGGKFWTCEYYPNGLPHVVTCSGAPTVTYAWDSMGRMSSLTYDLTNGVSMLTEWVRDAQTGRLASKKLNGTTVATYAWKPNGALDTATSSAGSIQCAYNDAGDLATVTKIPASGTNEMIVLAYDRFGTVLSNGVAGGVAETYAHNLDGSLQGVQVTGSGVVPDYSLTLPQISWSGQPQGFTLAQNGYPDRNASLLYAGTAKVTNMADGVVNASYLWAAGGHATNVTVSVAGQPVVTLSSLWNESLGVRTNLAAKAPNGSTLLSFGYLRGPGTNLISGIVREDGSSRVVGYDSTGRLQSWKYLRADGTADYDRTWIYGYDGANNLVSAGHDTTVPGGPAQMSPMATEYATRNVRPATAFEVNGYNLCSVRRWYAVDLVCQAATNARVTVNGIPARQSGNRFVVSIPLAQNSSAHVTNLTVCAVMGSGTNLEYYTTNVVQLTLPAYPESLQTTVGDSVNGDSVMSYTFDAFNQLRQVTDQQDATAVRLQSTYDYYPDGRRARKTVTRWDGSQWQAYRTVQYVWQGWNVVREIVQENGVTTTRDFAWGLDLAGVGDGQWGQKAGGIGGLLAITEVVGTSTNVFVPIHDHQGTVHVLVAAMTNNVLLATPVVVAQYEHDAWGDLLTASGPFANSCPFLYQSKYRDCETGLVYFGYRFYDPKMGKFITADPAGEIDGGANLTEFCGSDPVNKTDSYGLEALIYYTGPNGTPTCRAPGEVDMPLSPGEERAVRVLKTAVVVGLNVGAWAMGPEVGIPVNAFTLGMGAATAENQRQAQYLDTNHRYLDDDLTRWQHAKLLLSDVSGVSAGYTVYTGDDMLTGLPVGTGNRVETAFHLGIGLGTAHATPRVVHTGYLCYKGVPLQAAYARSKMTTLRGNSITGRTTLSIPRSPPSVISDLSVFKRGVSDGVDLTGAVGYRITPEHGYFDVIAHGGKDMIQVVGEAGKVHNDVRPAVLARYLSMYTEYAGQNIRLLSCNTGATPSGFAAILNKILLVEVLAPDKPLFVFPDGTIVVSDGVIIDPVSGMEAPVIPPTGRLVSFGGGKP